VSVGGSPSANNELRYDFDQGLVDQGLVDQGLVDQDDRDVRSVPSGNSAEIPSRYKRPRSGSGEEGRKDKRHKGIPDGGKFTEQILFDYLLTGIYLDLGNIFASADHVPKWARHCLEMFTTGVSVLGDDWRRVVCVWGEYELKRGLVEKGKGFGSTTGRPTCIPDWVQRARKPTWRPVVSVPAISDGFRTWWRANQPAWRTKNTTGMDLQRDGDDWEAVDVAGPNGLSTVMAVLFFWGTLVHAREDSVEAKEWSGALLDVAFVLEHLVDL